MLEPSIIVHDRICSHLQKLLLRQLQQMQRISILLIS